VIKWHREEHDRKKLLHNIKTYREKDVRKQHMMMEQTLCGGKSNMDSLWGGSSLQSNNGGNGYKTYGTFFNKRGSTAGKDSHRISYKKSIG
jgi:hypothetical protein